MITLEEFEKLKMLVSSGVENEILELNHSKIDGRKRRRLKNELWKFEKSIIKKLERLSK